MNDGMQNQPPQRDGADSATSVADREYQHQRECILQYLEVCQAASSETKRGSILTQEDHYGSEFDTLTVIEVARAFISTTDMRMQVGLEDERAAIAVLTYQFRQLLPTAPLATTLDRAVRNVRSQANKAGGAGRVKIAEANAERARDIIEAAERKPGRPDLFKHPGAILDAVRVRLNMPQLDRNTLNAYRRIVDETVRTDASHPEP